MKTLSDYQLQIQASQKVEKKITEQFNEIFLENVFIDFCKLLQQQGKSYAANFFETAKRTLDNTIITIESSTFDANYVKDYKNEIIEICRNQTGVKIEICNQIVQTNSSLMQVEIPITAKSKNEQFNFLAEKNPSLLDLKTQFRCSVE